MKKKNRKLSGWVRRKADRAYLRLWNHTRTRQWMHPCRIISLSLAFCLLSSFALAQEDTNQTLAASETVNALAELPDNPPARLATRCDMWLATALLFLGLLSIQISMLVLYRRERAWRQSNK